MKKIILGLLLSLTTMVSHATVVDEDIKKGQLDEAHKVVEQEIAKSPESSATWLAYAKLMLAKGDPEKAWAGLSQARKIIQTTAEVAYKSPSIEAEYYQIEGEWHFQKKEYSKATQSFKHVLQFNTGSVEPQLWLSCALLADNKFSDATSLINNLYKNDPKNQTVAFLYTITNPSEKRLLQLVKSQPDLIAPRLALINFYMSKEQYATAKKMVEATPSTHLTQFPFVLLASEIALYQKQPQEVIKKLKPIIQTNEDYRLLSLMSVSNALLGNFNEANAFFEKALKAKEYHSAELDQPASLKMRQNQLDYIDKLLLSENALVQIQYMPSGLGKIAYYFKQNQIVEARKEAKNWIQAYPREAFSYDVLGSVNKAEGDYHSAEMAFKSAIKINETYLPARLHLIDIFIKQRKYQEARKLLIDTSKKFKPDSRIFLLWSKLEEFEGNRDAAKKWLEKAASIEQNIEPGLEFVSFYLRQDRPKLALLLAENLAKIHGNDIRLLHLLGGLYLENTNSYPKAIEVFEKLATFVPDSPGVALNLSRSYQNAGLPEKALTVLETHLRKQPAQVDVQRQLARLYLHNRNYDKAKEGFEKILKAHPEDYISLNNLASLYIERDPKRALSFAKQAYEHAPNNAAVCDTLGWAYFKNHQVAKSVDFLQKANKLDANLADATYHLALVYREQGQKEAAVGYLKQALASADPQFSSRTQANTLLKNW